ncbi:sulfotransferase family 2 domain-containing protein [Asticcacaulis sp. EMRT-3]|uniref:sulfotransferase family 2 domain-containing protein n=1 Tax=Asticcacaulis sp. EMRT-3 TaxID=3040349 RepID=UPI0024AE8EA1|nr:sulfotransferase family 2 domain-containing protein [Asticcacaulis sp. EMRT-3]MDI7775272.1 sulfotransferase family 2 domain-containing protein [Asticcacaulis sp. EMRT-3]
MISHDHKCIFIHIPRCAGTSIESWIGGQDWWYVESSTKHVIASQAKEIYSEYWNEYFKFSVVRNPYTRVLSSLKYMDYFGTYLDSQGNIDFSEYHKLFGSDVVLECDYRFYDRKNILKPHHIAGQVYGNILDEPLDYIIRYENLHDDVQEVGQYLGLKTEFNQHLESSQTLGTGITSRLTDKTQAYVSHLYSHDFLRYGYTD